MPLEQRSWPLVLIFSDSQRCESTMGQKPGCNVLYEKMKEKLFSEPKFCQWMTESAQEWGHLKGQKYFSTLVIQFAIFRNDYI